MTTPPPPPYNPQSSKPSESVAPTSMTPGPSAAGNAPKKSGGLPKVVLIVGAVVVGALVMAALTSKSSKSATPTAGANGGTAKPGTVTIPTASKSGISHTQPVVLTGTPLVEFADGTDPAKGILAPTIVGADFAGKPISVKPGDGKPKMLVFVAHWCPHCQKEIPLVTGWIKDGTIPASIDVVAISTAYVASRGNPPSTWLETVGWPAPVIADDEKGSAAVAYGLSSFPYFVMLDGQGNVLVRAAGELDLAHIKALVAMVVT
jgi:cytochrome c biogenesis protein CcmG, thiol:disulfide interchange protein DsbE